MAKKRFFLTISVFLVIIVCFLLSSAYAGTWCDDFEDGDIDGWKPFGGTWEVENGELVFKGGGFSQLYVGEENWSNYTMQADIMVKKLLAGAKGYQVGIAARYCRPQPRGWYEHIFLWIEGNTHVLTNFTNAQGTDDPKLIMPFNLEEERWYKFKIKAEKEHIETYLDDKLMAKFDDVRADSGTAALSANGVVAHFDNIIITGPQIPDNGGANFTVDSKGKIAAIWANLKTNQ